MSAGAMGGKQGKEVIERAEQGNDGIEEPDSG